MPGFAVLVELSVELGMFLLVIIGDLLQTIGVHRPSSFIVNFLEV